MSDVKMWVKDLMRYSRQAGSTTTVARAAVRGRNDVAVVVASSNAARDFRSRYLAHAARESNLTMEHFPSSPAVRFIGEDGSSHTVYVLVAGQETRGLPVMPILFDPAVVYLVASFGQASPSLGATLREVALFGATAGMAGLAGFLLRPLWGRWAVGVAVAAGTLVPAVRALRLLRRR